MPVIPDARSAIRNRGVRAPLAAAPGVRVRPSGAPE